MKTQLLKSRSITQPKLLTEHNSPSNIGPYQTPLEQTLPGITNTNTRFSRHKVSKSHFFTLNGKQNIAKVEHEASMKHIIPTAACDKEAKGVQVQNKGHFDTRSRSTVVVNKSGKTTDNRRHSLNADIPDVLFTLVEPSGRNEHYVTQDGTQLVETETVPTPYEHDIGTVPRKALGKSIDNASWGSIRQLRDWKGVLAVPNGQRGIDKGQLLMNDNNREHFGKKVYLEEHNKPNYMSSSFGFIYENSDGKSMVPLNRDISDDELKGYLAADKKRSGSIGHTKVETRPQNAPLTSDDM